MALKVLQITGAVAIVILVLLLIPVFLRLRRTMDEVGNIMTETRPQAVNLLRKAQVTVDSVNREISNIGEITEDAQELVGKAGEATEAVERAVKSPLAKAGFVSAGVAAACVGVKRSLSRKKADKG